jgi:Glyoxalase-like domain
MASKFTELAIDCADPNALARFWCSVLDYEVQEEGDDGVVTIGSSMVPEGEHRHGRKPPPLTFPLMPDGNGTVNVAERPSASRRRREPGARL